MQHSTARRMVDVSLENARKLVTWSPGHYPPKLPQAVRDLAEVLGRERALFLIGQLPVCYVKDKRYNTRATSKGASRVVMYVPKKLKPDHRLVSILGWLDAEKLVHAFGGEIICPPTLRDVVYLPHRDAAIIILSRVISLELVSDWFGMTEQRVRQVTAGEKTPQEARSHANDNHAHSAERSA